MTKNSLSTELIKDCQRVGNAVLQKWFDENDIELSKTKSLNFYERIAASISEEKLTTDQILAAIAEIEESSDKKIFLLKAKNFDLFERNKNAILKEIRRKYGYQLDDNKWVTSRTGKNPQLINFYWNEGLIKIKFGELQFNREANMESSSFVDNPKPVNVIFLIDTSDGFVQIRMDSPGNIHVHKNDDNKATEAKYEFFYRKLLNDLFPTISFVELNLVPIANHICSKELNKFRINKGVTTITNNAKQIFATASTGLDIRNLPEYEAAAASSSDIWLTEDLTGYWLENESDGELTKDLFMRISQKSSQIRIQRGCLEKELNYGISQIREIQKTI